MSPLLWIAKAIGGPGSLRLLELSLACGLLWGYFLPRHRRVIGRGLLLIAGTYLTLALPIVASAIVRQLPAVAPPAAEDVRNFQTLFILDGDNRFGRVREFERIYRLARPRSIFFLGRLSVYADLLLMDIPRSSLHHDDSSQNTVEQIVRVGELVAQGASAAPAVIVSLLHAPRVARLARAHGLSMPIIPSPLDVELPASGLWAWVPSFGALAVTRDALYELAALSYYQ